MLLCICDFTILILNDFFVSYILINLTNNYTYVWRDDRRKASERKTDITVQWPNKINVASYIIYYNIHVKELAMEQEEYIRAWLRDNRRRAWVLNSMKLYCMIPITQRPKCSQVFNFYLQLNLHLQIPL